LKILQINSVINSGSTGRIAEEIGRVLIEHGHESYIAYGRNERLSESNQIKIGTESDIYKHSLRTLFFDQHGLGSSRATKDFLRKVDKIKPDVVGLHNIHGYYINYKILFDYLKSKQIPVLWTLHDCWSFTGHCSYFDSANCMKWQTHCYSCPKISYYPKALVDRSFKNFDDKKESFTNHKNLLIVTPSQWLADHVKNSFLKQYPRKVINNGIDLETFRPTKNLNEDKKRILLGVASTWDERKGLKDFIELSKHLGKEYQIVLIGLSNQQIKILPNNIKGIQRTENVQELVEWYNKAEVFLNPTYVDNFPTTNIEALACGTPVITYDTGGCPEAIDQDTGIVIEKGNLELFQAAIGKIKKDKITSAKCRERAVNYFDGESRYLDYLALYLNLCK